MTYFLSVNIFTLLSGKKKIQKQYNNEKIIFKHSYKDGVEISKVTLLAMSDGYSTVTIGHDASNATSLGTFPAIR